MKEHLMQQAIERAVENVRSGQGGPFAALVVRNGEVLARGTNRVTTLNDPTAHAEMEAIRSACEALGDFRLEDCDLYTTCEPCPMCLGAIYWARLEHVYYAGTQADAADAGFDDRFIYSELKHPPQERRLTMKQLLEDEAHRPFAAWRAHGARVEY